MVFRASALILAKQHGALCKDTPATKAALACSYEQCGSTLHDQIALAKHV